MVAGFPLVFKSSIDVFLGSVRLRFSDSFSVWGRLHLACCFLPGRSTCCHRRRRPFLLSCSFFFIFLVMSAISFLSFRARPLSCFCWGLAVISFFFSSSVVFVYVFQRGLLRVTFCWDFSYQQRVYSSFLMSVFCAEDIILLVLFLRCSVHQFRLF